MAKKDTKLRLSPKHVTDEVWFYEDAKGLPVVHEIRTAAGGYIRTDQFVIPRKSVLAYAAKISPSQHKP